jgi:hypothetical protein
VKPYQKDPSDKDFEHLMLRLFRIAGFAAEYEPLINGKTPDMLVKADDGVEFIVECTTIHWEGRHSLKWDKDGGGYIYIDDSDPLESNRKLWHSIKDKLHSYGRNTFPTYGLVIAIYNWSLFNDDSHAVEVCFGQYDQYLTLSDDNKVVGGGWRRALDPNEYPAIFEEHESRHCSAIIYSTHLFALDCVNGEYKHVNNAAAHHLLIPNPNADRPVSERLFPFCDVLDLPQLRNSDGSVPMRKALA